MDLKIVEELKYPKVEAMKSVLEKIGVDVCSRDLSCQDSEYTTCRLSELDAYIDLYQKNDTSIYEKRVLGGYILECLNEHVSTISTNFHRQDEAFRILHADLEIHETELEYFTDTTNREVSEYWPVTLPIFAWRKENSWGDS